MSGSESSGKFNSGYSFSVSNSRNLRVTHQPPNRMDQIKQATGTPWGYGIIHLSLVPSPTPPFSEARCRVQEIIKRIYLIRYSPAFSPGIALIKSVVLSRASFWPPTVSIAVPLSYLIYSIRAGSGQSRLNERERSTERMIIFRRVGAKKTDERPKRTADEAIP